MTREVDPGRLAIWTLERFAARFCEYAYEVYDQMNHPALGQSPREAFAQGMHWAESIALALAQIDRMRRSIGLAARPPSLHMSFTGKPSTGKTTVVMRMATILHRRGILPLLTRKRA